MNILRPGLRAMSSRLRAVPWNSGRAFSVWQPLATKRRVLPVGAFRTLSTKAPEEHSSSRLAGGIKCETVEHDHVELAAEVTALDGKFLLAFTCNVCQTRVQKMVSHKGYKTGVVIVRCDGCEKQHLVADNLGWFQDGKNIEEMVRARQPDAEVKKTSIRAKDAEGQAILDQLLKSNPALLEQLAKAKAAAKDSGKPLSVKLSVPCEP